MENECDKMQVLMISEEIKQIIQAGESETVEFKQSTSQLPRAIETVCAFANHKGGMLVFGVSASGEIVG